MDRLVTDSLARRILSALNVPILKIAWVLTGGFQMLANLLPSQIDEQRKQRRSYTRILGLELTDNISKVLSRVIGSILGHRYHFRPRRFQDNAETFTINTHSALEDTLIFIVQFPILPSFHDFLSRFT